MPVSGVAGRFFCRRRSLIDVKRGGDLSTSIARPESPRASDIVRLMEILARQNHISGTVQRGSRSAGSGLNRDGAKHSGTGAFM